MSAPLSRDYIRFARAALLYLASTGFMTWREHNMLMQDVRWHEMRLWGCEGKQQFRSFEQAAHVAMLRTRSRDGHRVRNAYHCKVCGWFHVTTTDPGARRAKKRVKQRRMERDYA